MCTYLHSIPRATQLTRRYCEKLAGKLRKEKTTITGGIVQKLVSTVERTTTNLYNAICDRGGYLCVGEDDKDIIVGIWTSTTCRVMLTHVHGLLDRMVALEALMVKLDQSSEQLVKLVSEQRAEIRGLRPCSHLYFYSTRVPIANGRPLYASGCPTCTHCVHCVGFVRYTQTTSRGVLSGRER